MAFSQRKPLVILAAVGMELEPLRRRFPLLHVISRKKPLKLECRQTPSGPVLMGLTGIGPLRAARAMMALLQTHDPGAILSLGFAGGLQKDLKIGDLICADACYQLQKLEPLHLEQVSWVQNPQNRPRSDRLASWRRGSLITASEVITRSRDKQILGSTPETRSPPLVVEMETAALLHVLLEMGRTDLPFVSLRTITDTLEEDIEVDFNRLQNFSKGTSRKLSALAYFLQHPRAFRRLTRLIKDSRHAALQLADSVTVLLRPENISALVQ